MRSVRLQWETAQLASLLSLLSVVPAYPGAEAAGSFPTVARGERLCYAYEIYQATIPSAQISFEHAVFLATALARGDRAVIADPDYGKGERSKP